MNDNLKIFSGTASVELSKEIALRLGMSLGEIYHHSFKSGEHYVQFKENIRGCDVFLIQSAGVGTRNNNDSLMQLLIMVDAAKRASANRITVVCPMAYYERQDRKDKSRVPITAKLIMNMFKAAGVDRIVTMDLHTQQIQGFTDLPIDVLQFRPTLANALKSKKIDIVVTPDVGGVKRASEYAEKENLDLAIIIKKRKSETDVEITQFVGDVKGKNVLILDDLTESAGTLGSAATCCKKNGAKKIYLGITHGCLTSDGTIRLMNAFEDGIIDQFYCSNTVTGPWEGNEWATIVSVADVFAKAIYGIHTNTSISQLFI